LPSVLLLNQRIEQLLVQLIAAQPFEGPSSGSRSLRAEIDPQTLLKERANRVLPEAQQLFERQ
jgi:hypothetical protein